MEKHKDDPSDEDIIQLLHNEPQESPKIKEGFIALQEKYYHELIKRFKYKYPKENSKDEIRGIIHDIFIEAFIMIRTGKYEHRGMLLAYLTGIGRNLILNGLKNYSKFEFVGEKDEQFEDLSEVNPEIRERAKSERIRIKRKCFEELDKSDKEIFEKKYDEKKSFKEIAEEIGIKPVTLRQRIYFIRKKLKLCVDRNSSNKH